LTFHAKSCTRPSKPPSVTAAVAFAASHTRTEGSLPTDASTLSATGFHCSSDTGLPCPASVAVGSFMFSVRPPSGMVHSLIDASSDPVASKLSLKGFHAVSNTAPEWPLIRGAPRGSLPTAV